MSCHVHTELTTWFGLMTGVETKSDQYCVFDNRKLNDYAMTYLLEHLKHSFFMRYLFSRAASEKSWEILILDISGTDEETDEKTHRDIKSSRCWWLKPAINGTRKASQQWQDY